MLNPNEDGLMFGNRRPRFAKIHRVKINLNSSHGSDLEIQSAHSNNMVIINPIDEMKSKVWGNI